MDDLISRKAAIEAVEFGITYVKMINKETGEVIMQFEQSNKELLKATDRIKELPPVERKKGKWKETDDGWDGTYYVCSECGCPWTLIDGDPEDNGMNYCPNCGADMRGETDETG